MVKYKYLNILLEYRTWVTALSTTDDLQFRFEIWFVWTNVPKSHVHESQTLYYKRII